MSKLDYLLTLCAELSAMGKTPTVGLIKNAAKQPVSIPDAVKALQHFKTQPNQQLKAFASNKSDPQPKASSLPQRVTQLENQVAELQRQIAELNNKING